MTTVAHDEIPEPSVKAASTTGALFPGHSPCVVGATLDAAQRDGAVCTCLRFSSLVIAIVHCFRNLLRRQRWNTPVELDG